MTTRFRKSLLLQERFNDIIPGGCHTYAKGDDQFPESMAPYIVKGRGSRVWDIDGNRYIEYGSGLRSVSLGHAFQPVVKAAARQMKFGTNFCRPTTIELECAEEFLSIVDGADMVKFCKNGSDAVDAAVRLARAVTGREMIGVCADHPFFSGGDWFVGSTEMSAGVPECTRKLTTRFGYNDLASVEKMFKDHPLKVAAAVLEPEKYDEPVDGFLSKLLELCHRNGALLIFDEMITGFRWALGGAQKKYNVAPDLSTWGKALGNGFSIAALAGKREFMKLGGLHHEKPRVFLLSSTHGGETHNLAAALATMKFYKERDVVGQLYKQGAKLVEGITKAGAELCLNDKVKIVGPASCAAYTTYDNSCGPSQPFRTLFFQETLKRGLLMPSSIVCYSHTDAEISETIDKIQEVLVIYRKALNEGVERYLEGRPIQPVYRKYN
jgi:glutamate-1-semialdehyde 2,1-aminomutase